MTSSLHSVSQKAGLPPGTLVHVGQPQADAPRITLTHYNSTSFQECSVQQLCELFEPSADQGVTWISVEGLPNPSLLEEIGHQFAIHPLILEDILNTHQRPKFEEYDNCLYLVAKGVAPQQQKLSPGYEQISIVLLNDVVLTFKEKQDDLFEPLRHRLKNSKGKIRSWGSDYLAYMILDMVVDQYFALEDIIDEAIARIEEDLLDSPCKETLSSIQRLKNEMVMFKRHVSPLREVLNAIQRSESPLLQHHTQLYFRDVYDHVLRVHEAMESYRDIITGLLEIYVSTVSNKMNEIMKVLTVCTSIFIPLTFIVGVYGMNFEYMPELKWHWAYPSLWISFIVIPAVLLAYFRKKKWL